MVAQCLLSLSSKKKTSDTDTATLKDNDICEDSDDDFDDYSFQGYEEVDLHQCQAKNIKPRSSFHRDVIEKCPKVKNELSWLKRGKTALESFDNDEDYHKRCIKDAEKDDNVDLKQFVIASNEGTNPKRGNTQCTICFSEVDCYNNDGYKVIILTTHAKRKKCKVAKQVRKKKNIRKGEPNEKMRLRLALAEERYPAIENKFSLIEGSTEKVECLCGQEMSLRDRSVNYDVNDPAALATHLKSKSCRDKRSQLSSS